MTQVQLEIVSILERLGDDFSGLCLTWIRRQAIIFQQRQKREMNDAINEMIAQLAKTNAPMRRRV
jgi:hypothetical protein